MSPALRDFDAMGCAYEETFGDSAAGVYAVPITSNFYASDQWLQELKRRNQGADCRCLLQDS